MGLFSRSPKLSSRPPELRPPHSMWWWVLPAGLLIGAAVWATSAWLLQDLDQLPIDKQISARIEAARTALAAAAGVGAAVTLLLAVRRQRHQELATAHTTHDAAERRVTELYTKAVEQLGNDQAPVRLGGLYALERVAQDTPRLRQTIVDVICAYLRMPYSPPTDQTGPAEPAVPRAAIAGVSAPVARRDPHEEREVRLTAQRILTAHLRYEPLALRPWWQPRPADRNLRHWPDIRLDLTGATLVDFDLNRCRVGDVRFTGATFIGDSQLEGTVFTGQAVFGRTAFTGDTWLEGATFFVGANFGRATFGGGVWFEESTFAGPAHFDQATFTTNAWFEGVTFHGGAWFNEAKFGSIGASFGKAIFNGNARFDKATFAGDVTFNSATFRDTSFDEVTFAGGAWFEDATFMLGARFAGATFAGEAVFTGATGMQLAGLRDARVTPADKDIERRWPAEWRAESSADGWQTLRLASKAEEVQAADASET
ncbi:pentapeptide repeat-containing protein [Nonomuraea angiospora]|uniref:pentapeptide repeat-containing protein n=1 Tax=Nonomuraea angiospora TaxID=46172 RepID=UPI0033EBC2A5